jgi:pyridoxal phosphate enzyme (YggS family)
MAAIDIETVVRENLERVRERIADACHAAGRRSHEVTLIGVSKYVDAAKTAALVRSGCRDLGESRPQTFWEKVESPEMDGLCPRWHLIGHLQRNKTNRTVALGAIIHSVDSFRTLAALNKAAELAETVVEYLFEVNCSGDPEKHGMDPDQLMQDVEECGDFFRNTRLLGLMTMAAREGGRETARRNFGLLRTLRDKALPLVGEGQSLDVLSMGMSGDFEEAIVEGATHVRIGSALWEGIK